MTNGKVSLGIFLLLLCVAAFGCNRSETTEPKPGAASEVAKNATPAPSPCPADASWINAPNPPTEIGGPNPPPVGNETNCQFYQFAYQWFFAMTQPVERPVNVSSTLNVYQPKLKTSAPPSNDSLANIAKALRPNFKATTNDFDPILPGHRSSHGHTALRSGTAMSCSTFSALMNARQLHPAAAEHDGDKSVLADSQNGFPPTTR
jgi:hypothetical protein